MDFAQTLTSLGGVNAVIGGGVLLAGAGVGWLLSRLAGRLNAMEYEQYELRRNLHELDGYVDHLGQQLQANALSQHELLAQVVNHLQHGAPLSSEWLKQAQPLLDLRQLPAIDLHESDAYDGEPLLPVDPSRLDIHAESEPDLLSGIQPLAAGVTGVYGSDDAPFAADVANDAAADAPLRQAGQQ